MSKYNSPFNIAFGKKPNNIIQRTGDFDQITGVFDSDQPETNLMIITGPRGCGKTVLLTSISEYYDNSDNWLTVSINPNDDMLEQLAAKLYENGKVKKLFIKAEFNFSFKGFGFSIEGKEPVSSVYTILEKMLDYLKNKGMRILITIDDVSSSSHMKIFAHTFQDFMRKEYPTFLLMTGLYENIEKLQQVSNLTFLARAPKVYLNKLSIKSITLSYENIFKIPVDDAIRLAKQTNGYAYGYQLLGSILFKSNKTKIDEDVLEKYDLLLDDNAYSLIWNSLTTTEKNILFAIVNTDGTINNVIKFSGFSNAYIQVYKKKFIKNGIIEDSIRGAFVFTLPRFKEFVEFQYKLTQV